MNVIKCNNKKRTEAPDAEKDTIQAVNTGISDEISLQRHFGLSAQELQAICPELVKEGQDDYLGVNNIELVPVLIRSIQELKHQLNDLKRQLAAITPQQTISQLRKGQLVKAFKQRAKGAAQPSIPTDEQWERLYQHIRESLPQTYAVIGQTDQLTPLELRTALLTLLGFSNAEISALFGTKPQRVSNLKSVVNRKLFSDSSAMSLKANMETLEMENG